MLVDPAPDGNEVVSGCPVGGGEFVLTDTKIVSSYWDILDYGDSIPTVPGAHSIDVYEIKWRERYKFLIAHLDARIPGAPHPGNKRGPALPRLGLV